MLLVFKASLVGLAVYLSTLAGRKWGPRFSGLIAGLPMIAGPICAFLAYDLGADFVRKTAISTLQVMPAIGVFCLTYALLARTKKWWLCLGCAYGTYWASATACQQVHMPFMTQTAEALLWWLWAAVGWTLCMWALPRADHVNKALIIPRSELFSRIFFAMGVALSIGLTAPYLGSAWSGFLLGIPILGSVLPSFTLHLYGVMSTYQVLRGFLFGMFSFMTFFTVLAFGLGQFNTVFVFLIGLFSALLSARGLVFALRIINQKG